MKTLALRARVFIHCFLVFGYPGETLALVVHILHQEFIKSRKHYFFCYLGKRWEKRNRSIVHFTLSIFFFINRRYVSLFPLIHNGNCTEWSAIWCEIKCVITKSHDREAGVRFVITSLISHQNCTTRSAITTLL